MALPLGLIGAFIALVVQTARLVRASAALPPAPADAIVVFGAAVREGRPCSELRARLDHAALLHEQGWAPRIICSGGPEEATTMHAVLLARVGAGALVADPGGVSTRATIARLPRDERLLLVSSPWHVYRIVAEARRRGLAARACPAPTSPLSRFPRAHRRQIIREVAATWWYAASR